MKTIEQAAVENTAKKFDNRDVLIDTLWDSINDSFKAGVKFSQQWISVDDELPDANIPVLVRTSYGKFDICHRSEKDEKGDIFWINDMRPQHSNGEVTHWRYIYIK